MTLRHGGWFPVPSMVGPPVRGNQLKVFAAGAHFEGVTAPRSTWSRARTAASSVRRRDPFVQGYTFEMDAPSCGSGWEPERFHEFDGVSRVDPYGSHVSELTRCRFHVGPQRCAILVRQSIGHRIQSSAHSGEPRVARTSIDSKWFMAKSEAWVPSLRHIGRRTAPVLDQKQGQVPFGVREVLRVHVSQNRIGLDPSVKPVDEVNEEWFAANPVVKRLVHASTLNLVL